MYVMFNLGGMMPPTGPCDLHHPFDKTGIQVHDEHSQEGHLLAGVLEDDARVI